VVGVHAHGDTYGLERFKAGMSRLKYLEREEVGGVAGKSLLHLQCHFGLDTLSCQEIDREWHRLTCILQQNDDGSWRWNSCILLYTHLTSVLFSAHLGLRS
jgi:hypothetical protein